MQIQLGTVSQEHSIVSSSLVIFAVGRYAELVTDCTEVHAEGLPLGVDLFFVLLDLALQLEHAPPERRVVLSVKELNDLTGLHSLV